MSYYEAYDIAHVQETYPRARLYLVHRLGTAIRNHCQVFSDLELAEAHRVRLDIKSLDSQSVDTLGAVPMSEGLISQNLDLNFPTSA
jgi:hypothetical protein